MKDLSGERRTADSSPTMREERLDRELGGDGDAKGRRKEIRKREQRMVDRVGFLMVLLVFRLNSFQLK